MNLTNERLKEIAESCPRLGLTETEWRSIAAELLRWRETRAMRDVGDEEIRELNHNLLKRGCPSVWVCRLRDIAIARGRTRTDAVNKAAEWAKECGRLDEEVERLKKRVEAENGFAVKAGKMIDKLQDEARKELHKAPGMEEVDAELAYYHTNYHRGVSLQCVTKLANIARRSIAAMQYSMKNFMEMMNEQTRTINLIDNKFWEEKRKADEVVGLLKYLFRNQEFRNSFDWAILSEEARRILEIVEGE